MSLATTYTFAGAIASRSVLAAAGDTIRCTSIRFAKSGRVSAGSTLNETCSEIKSISNDEALISAGVAALENTPRTSPVSPGLNVIRYLY
ncbi:hypothetical protein D3C75_539790 [compost metagenome]